MIPPLTTVFARLTDNRSRRSRRHPLSQTLALIVIALLNGEQGLRGIARWLNEHRWQLQEPFKLRGGQVPSYGTVRRALLGVDVKELEQGLREWAEQVIRAKMGQTGYHRRSMARRCVGAAKTTCQPCMCWQRLCMSLGSWQHNIQWRTRPTKSPWHGRY